MFFKCSCEKPPFIYSNYDSDELGCDSTGAEVSIHTCKKCSKSWLKYLIEQPHYSKSSRWWLATLSATSISTELAKNYIESQKSCFIGGDYFESTGKKIGAPIKIT